MIEENPSNVIVNMQFLLGEQEVIQMEFREEFIQEKEEFVFDNVAYEIIHIKNEIVHIKNEDGEYPNEYVGIRNILSKT